MNGVILLGWGVFDDVEDVEAREWFKADADVELEVSRRFSRARRELRKQLRDVVVRPKREVTLCGQEERLASTAIWREKRSLITMDRSSKSGDVLEIQD
jgi:hypothetical protein